MIYGVFERHRKTTAPREIAVDGEPGSVSEIQDVEVALLGLVTLQGSPIQGREQVVEKDRPLSDAEDS